MPDTNYETPRFMPVRSGSEFPEKLPATALGILRRPAGQARLMALTSPSLPVSGESQAEQFAEFRLRAWTGKEVFKVEQQRLLTQEMESHKGLGWELQMDHAPSCFGADVVGEAPSRQDLARDLTNILLISSGEWSLEEIPRFSRLSSRASSENVDGMTLRHRLARKIQSYAHLQTDWDCEGGHAPLKKDIENAVHFLWSLQSGDIPRPMVAGDGDVGFTWKTKFSYLEVGFCDDGQISFYGKTPSGHEDGGDHDYANEGIPKKLWKLLESIAHVVPQID